MNKQLRTTLLMLPVVAAGISLHHYYPDAFYFSMLAAACGLTLYLGWALYAAFRKQVQATGRSLHWKELLWPAALMLLMGYATSIAWEVAFQ